ncbi:hypothetical protein [Ottowia sp.]|uniref:hypothetical protein n=1 Tax=Ottowia sp. TaxID=1898956 RepID=UPI0025E5766A|nr:hypothetical protein [Ottowia sp.]MBK6616162.1 hypothetical protein [Ottowia sp.]
MRAVITLLASLCVAVPCLSGDSLTPAGRWSGNAKFTSSVFGADDPVFFGEFDIRVDLTIYGDVAGSAPENQCVFTGKATPVSPGSSVAALALTVSGCANPGYNGRYEGRMTPTSSERANFQVTSVNFDRALAGAARRTSIASSLRR